MKSLTEQIEPDSLLLLTCYEPIAAAAPLSDEQFVSAYRAAAELPAGVLHRELYRQVPAWNEKVTAEMETPVPFPFLEYAVLRADTDPADATVRSDAIQARYRCVSATYQVAFRFVRGDRTVTPQVVMFNLFEIHGPPALLQGFVMGWAPRGAFRARDATFVSAMLHVGREAGARITAFNRSEWQDVDGYARAIPAFEEAFPRTGRGGAAGPGGSPGKVTSHLGMFQTVVSLPGQAPERPTMKAVRLSRFGGPEGLRYEDAPLPAPAPGQVLIRVRAVDVTPLDGKLCSGEVQRIYPPWFPDGPGYCVAGVVAAVGRGVDSLHPGAEVYASISPIARRGFAEYAVAEATHCATKPANLSFEEAAAAISGLVTAHNAVLDAGGLRAGQTVLVHGGSGAVGAFAVQLAKVAGARVIATGSAANRAYLLDLGADAAVDYRSERFEDHAAGVDLVIDSIGGETRARSFGLLRRGGALITLVPPVPDPVVAAASGVRAQMIHGHPEPGQVLRASASLFESGQLHRPRVALVLPLAQAAEAISRLAEASRTGRVVLAVGDP